MMSSHDAVGDELRERVDEPTTISALRSSSARKSSTVVRPALPMPQKLKSEVANSRGTAPDVV